MADDWFRNTVTPSREVPHWIHAKIKDPSYTSGFKYSHECSCSVCGLTVGHEMPYCPGCHTRMN